MRGARTRQRPFFLLQMQMATKPCEWAEKRKNTYVFIPFTAMKQLAEFTMKSAIVEIEPGEFLHQRTGIPMGDPISPAMTLAACGAMEINWMKTVPESSKEMFKIGRYMDDILAIYAVDKKVWNDEEFIKSLERSDCYTAPLKLEDGGDDTFLETTFETTETNIRYRLKNVNEKETKVWRYQNYYSYATFKQKRALLTASLRKIQKMCSDSAMLYRAAVAKLTEFRKLQYPNRMLKAACGFMSGATQDDTWTMVKNGM